MASQVETVDAIWRVTDRQKAQGRPVPRYWLNRDLEKWWRKAGQPVDQMIADGEAYVLVTADFSEARPAAEPAQPDLFGAAA